MKPTLAGMIICVIANVEITGSGSISQPNSDSEEKCTYENTANESTERTQNSTTQVHANNQITTHNLPFATDSTSTLHNKQYTQLKETATNTTNTAHQSTSKQKKVVVEGERFADDSTKKGTGGLDDGIKMVEGSSQKKMQMHADILPMDLEEEPIIKKKDMLEEVTEATEVKVINNWNKEEMKGLKCQSENDEDRLEADLLKERYDVSVDSDKYNEVEDGTNGDR